MDNAVEPIADDELLYRRVPASTGWYEPATRKLSPQAFAPHKTRDKTGLSVSRAKYRGRARDEAMRGRPGKKYYVAVLRAGDLKQHEIDVVPRPETPEGHDPAHAELPGLNADNRKSDETLERQRVLAEQLCLRVEGPFEVPDR